MKENTLLNEDTESGTKLYVFLRQEIRFFSYNVILFFTFKVRNVNESVRNVKSITYQ